MIRFTVVPDALAASRDDHVDHLNVIKGVDLKRQTRQARVLSWTCEQASELGQSATVTTQSVIGQTSE
jgi:hypothetical protein